MADEKKAKKTKKAAEATTPGEPEAPPPPAADAPAEPAPEAAPPAAEPSVEPTPAPPVESSGNISSNPTNASHDLQRLEEKAKKAEELHAAEVKVRKELEALNAKLLAEKTALLDSLSGEKGALQDYQERNAKLTAQKNDLENQLRVSIFNNLIAAPLPCPSLDWLTQFPPRIRIGQIYQVQSGESIARLFREIRELMMCALNLARDRSNTHSAQKADSSIKYIYVHTDKTIPHWLCFMCFRRTSKSA